MVKGDILAGILVGGLGAILVTVLILVSALVGTVFGWIAGWILSWNWFNLGTFVVNGANNFGLKIGLGDLPNIGAFLGFVGGFFKSSHTCKHKDE